MIFCRENKITVFFVAKFMIPRYEAKVFDKNALWGGKQIYVSLIEEKHKTESKNVTWQRKMWYVSEILLVNKKCIMFCRIRNILVCCDFCGSKFC